MLVATKGGLRMEGGRLLRDASGRWLREGVESSLRNLDTDYVDLYQVHWPNEHTPAEETAGAMEDLMREGKIRHVGVSNYDVKQLEDLARFGKVETVQPPYHLFRREIEDEILPYAMDHDLGVLVYGSMAHGLLTGTMTPKTRFARDDWRAESPDFAGETSKVPLGKSPTVEMTRRRVRRARSFRFGFISDWSEPVARLLENDRRIGRTLGACAEALFGHSVAGLVPDPCFEDVWRPRPLRSACEPVPGRTGESSAGRRIG